jgi:hypothetical protein
MTHDIPGISFNAQSILFSAATVQRAFVILLIIPLVHRSRTGQAAVGRCCRIAVRLGYRPHHRCMRRALDNRPSMGLRWQVKNSWGHDHDLPSPATHSHIRPAPRPTQRPRVRIHLQLVGTCNFVGHIK